MQLPRDDIPGETYNGARRAKQKLPSWYSLQYARVSESLSLAAEIYAPRNPWFK